MCQLGSRYSKSIPVKTGQQLAPGMRGAAEQREALRQGLLHTATHRHVLLQLGLDHRVLVARIPRVAPPK